jgi:hypothetical protein
LGAKALQLLPDRRIQGVQIHLGHPKDLEMAEMARSTKAIIQIIAETTLFAQEEGKCDVVGDSTQASPNLPQTP